MQNEDKELLSNIFTELRLIKSEMRMRSLQSKLTSTANSLDVDCSKVTKELTELDKNIFSQNESLINIHSLLDIRLPLPKMRGWAISPDFAELLLSEILIRKPANIVEFGSGVSTIITGYALEINNKGHLTSYDHDIFYGDKTAQSLKNHGLSKFATVIDTPISKVNINGRDCNWYGINPATIPKKIDMLVIDGPPAKTDNEARFPALPFLIEHLANDAVIILDDGIRQQEKDICKQWVAMFPEFTAEYVETEKGAFILRRNLT